MHAALVFMREKRGNSKQSDCVGTGHCPTLKFQYGTSYGTRTKEILQDLKQKQIIGKPRPAYRYNNEHDRAVLQPIERTKGQTTDPASETRNRAPRYIIGYTGYDSNCFACYSC